MPRALNPLRRLLQPRSAANNSAKLYGAIVAQARLPAFYRGLSVADTVQGRFASLSLHLFLVLHRLKRDGGAAAPLAQSLVDRFSKDMETVLREMGVSDLRIPKAMRDLAASSHGLLEHYDTAFAKGEAAFAAAIEVCFPLGGEGMRLSSALLASYVKESVRLLERQPLPKLEAGEPDFAEVPIPS
jgi:cytochrome b pre-mRNA-processing protein 3